MGDLEESVLVVTCSASENQTDCREKMGCFSFTAIICKSNLIDFTPFIYSNVKHSNEITNVYCH